MSGQLQGAVQRLAAASLVREFEREVRSAHVRQQVGRFVRLVVVAFVAQLAAVGTGHLGRAAVVAAAVGAVEAAYRQWAVVVPLVGVRASVVPLASGAVAAGAVVVPPGAGPGVVP